MVKNLFQLMILGFFALTSLFVFGVREAKASDKLFVDNKCNKCHAISAYNIEKKKGAKEDSDDEDEDKDKIDPPDLSNVGTFHDAAFITSFLKKEVEHKPHAGNDSKKKHKVKFKGSEDDLKGMVDWLVTLKKQPTAK
jgi:hypothetical protein